MTHEQLIAHAQELGLNCENLDETILDLEHDEASKRVNHGADYDVEHDDADDIASAINNQGFRLKSRA